MTAKIGRSLTYVVTLLLGVLLGFLFAKSGNAPKPSPEYRSLVQSSGAPLLSSSSNADASKRRFGDVGDQSVNSNLSVPIRALKNMGFDGINIIDGVLQIDDTLVEILGISDVEAAKLKEHFSSVLSRVRDAQVSAAEVISHDPDGESVIKVAASSEEHAQLWQEEIHTASAEVLGNKRGDQFREIISKVLLHSLAYPAMTITATRSSESGLSEGGFFEFVIASENGTKSYNSTSAPREIAHLIGLSEPSER